MRSILLPAVAAAAIAGGLAMQPAPARADCADLKDLLDTFQELCLVNRAVVGSLDISGKISLFDRSLEASGEAVGERLIGAARDLDDAIRATQDDAIRTCLEPLRREILTCVLDQTAAARTQVPDELALKFKLRFKGRDDAFLTADSVVLGVKAPPRAFPELPARRMEDWFVEYIGMPGPDRRFDGYLVRQVEESFVDAEDHLTGVCLQRHDPMPGDGGAFSALICEEEEGCSFHRSDPGWLQFCPEEQTGLDSPFRLIASAHAQDPRLGWKVPSLRTLQDRDNLGGVGYTVFEVRSDAAPDVDADAVAFALTANGTQVRVDDLPPEYASLAYEPGSPVRLRFALQNLNFAGVEAGCDRIGLGVFFLKDGQRVGDTYALTRSYVALRDARPTTVEAGACGSSGRGSISAPRRTSTSRCSSSPSCCPRGTRCRTPSASARRGAPSTA